MEYYNDILCIKARDLIISEDNPNGILSLPNYKKKVRGEKIKVVRRACKETPALVEFDTMPTKYKDMILETHTDPRVEAATAPFIKRIVTDVKAQEYYIEYRYNVIESLPKAIAAKYVTEASIWNALRLIVDNMTMHRKHSPQGTRGVWDYAVSCIDSVRKYYLESYGLKFPVNPIALKRRYKKYLAGGYEALVHSNYGNTNRNLIKENNTGELLLLTMLRKSGQHDMVDISKAYNLWAMSEGEEPITPRTALNFYENNRPRIDKQRLGDKAFNNLYEEVTRRKRPSAPLMLLNSDDNHLDAYFKASAIVNGKKKKTDYYRPKLYVVIDAYCDYPLGYAYGPQITKEVIREAFRNAMNHIKELTGGYCGFSQLVADRWGISPSSQTELQKFYESMAVFTPPTLNNARSKYIERTFGVEWHKHLKLMSNYSGTGIASKTKFSEEAIEAGRANFPKIDNAAEILAEFIEQQRNRPWKKSGKTRKELWLSDFTQKNVSAERSISDMTYLSLHGVQPEKSRRITNEGVELNIGKNEYVYDIPNEIYLKVVGRTAQIQYDPADMSRILVEDDRGARFIATANYAMPSTIDDFREGDKARLLAKIENKKNRKIEIDDEAALHASELAAAMVDVDGILKRGVLNKETRFDAEQILKIPEQSRNETRSVYDAMIN